MNWNDEPVEATPVAPVSTSTGGIRRGMMTAALAAMLLVGAGVAAVSAATSDPSESAAPTVTSEPTGDGTTTDDGTTGNDATSREDCPEGSGERGSRGSGGDSGDDNSTDNTSASDA